MAFINDYERYDYEMKKRAMYENRAMENALGGYNPFQNQQLASQ